MQFWLSSCSLKPFSFFFSFCSDRFWFYSRKLQTAQFTRCKQNHKHKSTVSTSIRIDWFIKEMELLTLHLPLFLFLSYAFEFVGQLQFSWWYDLGRKEKERLPKSVVLWDSREFMETNIINGPTTGKVPVAASMNLDVKVNQSWDAALQGNGFH